MHTTLEKSADKLKHYGESCFEIAKAINELQDKSSELFLEIPAIERRWRSPKSVNLKSVM